MKEHIMLYFAFFVSILTCAYIIYFFRLRKKVKRKIDENFKIVGQRERIEDQLYHLNEIMLSDPNRLFDNTKLLLEFPQCDLRHTPIPNYLFFQNLGIDITNISIKDKTVLCLMPFHKSFQKIYDAIKLSCMALDLECWRSDTPYNPGNVLQQIIKMLLEAQIIVAVLDGKNPNVFYEIGIAHSIGKPVILVANMDKKEDVPFDLRSDRLLLYSSPNDLSKKLLTILNNVQNA